MAANKELLAINRALRSTLPAFQVESRSQNRDFARYSDRYHSAASDRFRESRNFCMKEGVHYPAELTLTKKRKAGRKGRLREDLMGGFGGDLDEEVGEEGDDDGEAEDESGTRRLKKRPKDADKAAVEMDDDEEEADVDDDDEEDEDDEIMSDEGGVGAGDFEDGFDDADSGGEDELTY